MAVSKGGGAIIIIIIPARHYYIRMYIHITLYVGNNNSGTDISSFTHNKV